MPGLSRASCVSLKLATTHTSCSGTMARSGWPIWTTCPISTLRLDTTPSTAARTSVCSSWSSAKARSACASRSRASARLASASLIATWWIWLSASASAARASATRCRAKSTAWTRAPSSASACCTSRSVCVIRRFRASTVEPAVSFADSAWSKSRRATRSLCSRLRVRSSSRADCRCVLCAPLTSARIASVAARRASRRARFVDGRLGRLHADQRRLERRTRLVDLRAGTLPRQRHFGARGAEGRLGSGNGGPRLLAPGLEVPGIDAQQQVAVLDGLVVLDPELHDVARHLRADGRDRTVHVRVVGGHVRDRVVPDVAAVEEGRQADETAEREEQLTLHGTAHILPRRPGRG